MQDNHKVPCKPTNNYYHNKFVCPIACNDLIYKDDNFNVKDRAQKRFGSLTTYKRCNTYSIFFKTNKFI